MAKSTGKRRTQAERRHASEQALLDAATRLFARHGIDRTSLADINAEAGVSRALASHHFGSRSALVQRLAKRIQDSFVDSVTVDVDSIDTLVDLANAYLDAVVVGGDDARAFFVLWGSCFASEAPLREVLAGDDARFRDAIDLTVRSAQAAGTVSETTDPAGFALAYVALLRGLAAQYLVGGDAVQIDKAREVVTRFIHTALDTGSTTARGRG